MSKDRRHIPKQQTIFDCAFKIVYKNTKVTARKNGRELKEKQTGSLAVKAVKFGFLWFIFCSVNS